MYFRGMVMIVKTSLYSLFNIDVYVLGVEYNL